MDTRRGEVRFPFDDLDPDTVTLETFDSFIKLVEARQPPLFPYKQDYMYLNAVGDALKYRATRRLFDELRRPATV